MRRWTLRILVGLCGLIVVTAFRGVPRTNGLPLEDLAATPPPGHLVDIGGYRLQLASYDCLASRSARESNRWLRQCASSRGQRVSAQLDTRRRLTRLLISGEHVGSQELAPQAHDPCARRHRWTRSRRELATVATKSSLAVERGGLMIATVPVTSCRLTKVVVDAIRIVVETARGHDVRFAPRLLRTFTATHPGNEIALRLRVVVLACPVQSLSRESPVRSLRSKATTGNCTTPAW